MHRGDTTFPVLGFVLTERPIPPELGQMIMMYLLILAAQCAMHVMANSGVGHSVPAAAHSAINETQALLQQLADAKVFSGVVAVQKAGTLVYTGGYGYAVEVNPSRPDRSSSCRIILLPSGIFNILPSCLSTAY